MQILQNLRALSYRPECGISAQQKTRIKPLLKYVSGKGENYEDYDNLGDGKWIIIVSDNPKWLKEIEEIFPVVFSLTNRQSVFPLDGNSIIDYITGRKRNPLGFDEILPKIVMIHRVNRRKNKKIETFQADIGDYFDKWAGEPHICVIMTALVDVWNGPKKLLEDIEKCLGEYARMVMERKIEIKLMMDEREIEIPTSKFHD
jgi:hypothetical protein